MADTTKDPAPDRETEAREAELRRQADQVEAVERAGAKDLPKLGGPLLEPGLGR